MESEPTILSTILSIVICLFVLFGFIYFLFFLDRGMRRLLTMDLGEPVIKIRYKKK